MVQQNIKEANITPLILRIINYPAQSVLISTFAPHTLRINDYSLVPKVMNIHFLRDSTHTSTPAVKDKDKRSWRFLTLWSIDKRSASSSVACNRDNLPLAIICHTAECRQHHGAK